MNTFPLPNGVFHGPLSYNPSQGDAALEALYDMQTGPLLEDPHLMVTCMEMIIPAINLSIIDLIPFTDKLDFTGEYPPAIKPLLDIGPVATNMSRMTLTALASQNITPEFMSVYTARLASWFRICRQHLLTSKYVAASTEQTSTSRQTRNCTRRSPP